MPNTRASTRRLVSKRKLSLREHTVTSEDESNNSRASQDTDAETGMESIMDHLKGVKSGMKQLNTRIQFLERENGILRSELQQVQQNMHNAAGSSPGSREKTFRRRIQLQERTIVDLQAAREKDKRTIEKLRETEVRRDAKELAADHEGAVSTQQTDLGESAMKLLRCMCDTIDMNTLAEGEECAVCMEEMAVEKCYSLPCRHPVCVKCFQRLGDGSNTVSDHQKESVQCPHCREVCSREECEIITHTAVQQWDLLLDVSRQWAAMDIGEVDIKEEDDDGSSIDDVSLSARDSPFSPETLGEAADLGPEVSTPSALPNETGGVAYRSLTSPLKRKRLTELVAQRSGRQRV